ncbi:MAG: ParA family protein [Fusobacteriaceae bacterium]
MKIVSIVNAKGGVGKSTTAQSVASQLKRLGKKTLLVDLDPQGNTTFGSGFIPEKEDKTIKDLLLGVATAKECIVKLERYDLLGSDIRLAGAEMELFSKIARESILKNKLEELKNKYDFVIIDCPPSLSLFTLNGLVASSEVIIPASTSTYALTGLEELMNTIEAIKALNKKLVVKGIFLTQFDTRESFSHEVVEYIKELYPQLLLTTKIRRDATLNKAQSRQMDIFDFDVKSRVAQDYIELVKELWG